MQTLWEFDNDWTLGSKEEERIKVYAIQYGSHQSATGI